MHALLRFDVCLVIFLVTMVWEYRYPRRALVRPRHERWLTNLSLTTLNALLVWGTVGGIAYTTALFAVGKEMGLLHWVSVPPWVAAIVTFLVLDFAIYLQHVLFHAVPLLWRFHRVHHADLGFDATTGLRFHPVEIFLSLGLKSAIVLMLGATPWAVFAFEVALNVSSVFNHGNVAIPERWDRWLRRLPRGACIGSRADGDWGKRLFKPIEPGRTFDIAIPKRGWPILPYRRAPAHT